jgi:GDPmannose 4,6-dehydratase
MKDIEYIDGWSDIIKHPPKTALILGITGQDGSYLAELLLSKGYEVYGLVRRLSTPNTVNINHILNDIILIDGDLTDYSSLDNALQVSNPDEVYHLAAQSFVGTSWTQPLMTADVTGLGTLRILEAIRKFNTNIRFYNAASSEMFGDVLEMPQIETTPFNPRSPYGAAKVFGFNITKNYRESYNMYACSGILFNHESKRRGIEFVTRKITNAAARISLGQQDKLYLGNLDAKRDWGSAQDYVQAMWLILQQDIPDDYIIATGYAQSVREFCDIAFKHVGLDYNDYVEVDPKFFRPAEVDILLGDYSKARQVLGWEPETTFKKLVVDMVDNDLQIQRKLI